MWRCNMVTDFLEEYSDSIFMLKSEGTCCLYVHSRKGPFHFEVTGCMFLRNVDNDVASHPVRQSSYSSLWEPQTLHCYVWFVTHISACCSHEVCRMRLYWRRKHASGLQSHVMMNVSCACLRQMWDIVPYAYSVAVSTTVTLAEATLLAIQLVQRMPCFKTLTAHYQPHRIPLLNSFWVFQNLEDSCCGLLCSKTAQPSGRQEQTSRWNILTKNRALYSSKIVGPTYWTTW